MIHHNPADKDPPGSTRSGHWPKVREDHLRLHPACSICEATTGKIEVHHKKPFHTHPHLELDPSNLITLCENMNDGVSCHLLFGHLGNFKSVNLNIDSDSKEWRVKIATRPT